MTPSLHDIIIWNGAICEYGSISHLVYDIYDILAPNIWEVELYYQVNGI